MNESGHTQGAVRRGEGLLLGAITIAAYVGFAAFAILHDGGSTGGVAQAGVPVDAVRAAAASGGASNAAPATSRAGAVGAVIPPGVNVAEPTARIEVGGARPEALAATERGGDARLQFLVKFEEPEATEWRDRFLADPNRCREAFAAFARSRAAFAGLRLERVSYSGVLTLEFEGAAPSSARAVRELSDDIVRRVSAAQGVEYAEPNLVAMREDGE